MIFIILILYGMIAGIFISKKKIKMSQAILPIISFSSVALGQNYTESLIPEANDGIGITNFLAKFLLPDNYWTKEMFLSKFELYLGISIALTLLNFILVVVEQMKC